MKTILTLLLITVTTAGFTQTLSYSDLQTNEKPDKKNYTSYIPKSGLKINAGDTIYFGNPSNGNFYKDILKFDYISLKGSPIDGIKPSLRTIQKLGVVNSVKWKRNKVDDKFYAIITLFSDRMSDDPFHYFINIEDALISKEILLK